MIRFSLAVLLCAVALTGGARPALAATYYVATEASEASDANTGTAEAPWASLAHAVKQLSPGDTLVLREGVYRERLVLPSGEAGDRITVRAADGERAILSGAEPIGDWQPVGENRWQTTLDWEPSRLLLRGRPVEKARYPRQGWWRSASATSDALLDPDHLSGMDSPADSTEVRIWLGHGNVFATVPLQRLDAQRGAVEIRQPERPVRLTNGDKYFLQNDPAWIDKPGDWAVEQLAPDRYRLTICVADRDDLKRIEAPRQSRSLVASRDASEIRIFGLELVGSNRYGIEIHGGRGAHVERCIAYDNGGNGISMRETTDAVVRNCIAWRNGSGISVSYSRGATVERNEVAHNGVDGILVTWQSEDVLVRNNYVHHHLLWGHPDNMQVYRGVTNLRFVDNVLLAAGQSLMMEQTSQGQFRGNMVIGSAANMLIFGHENAGQYEIHGNTLAFSGYGCMSLTWKDYDVRENVMMTGHAGPIYGVRGVDGYRADRNLFWNADRAEEPRVMPTDQGWNLPFDRVREVTGQDGHSVYANPDFKNAPVAMAVVDSRRIAECSRKTLYLRDGFPPIRSGEHVEINFDGRVRRVVRAEEDMIAIDPPLDEKPIKGWIVANWGDRDDFRLDLRLTASSPGATLAADGGPVGSKLDIQAYQRGDFDGDGQRDIPPLPPELP